MSHHENTDDLPMPQPHDDSDLTRAALEMYRNNCVGDEGLACIDQLIQLHAGGEATKDELEEFVDKVVLKILDENSEFQTNKKAFRTVTRGSKKEQEIRDRQRELYRETRHAVLLEAGLPIDGAEERLAFAREKAQALLKDKLESMEDPSVDAVLGALDIVVTDDNGNEHFNYPHELFPEETNQKWEFYLGTVRTHLNLVKRLESKDGLVTQSDVREADLQRHLAHNAVTRDVDQILGLTTASDSKWSQNDSRDLVSKMRDKEFPTAESAEVHVTGRAVATALLGKATLETLLQPSRDIE